MKRIIFLILSLFAVASVWGQGQYNNEKYSYWTGVSVYPVQDEPVLLMQDEGRFLSNVGIGITTFGGWQRKYNIEIPDENCPDNKLRKRDGDIVCLDELNWPFSPIGVYVTSKFNHIPVSVSWHKGFKDQPNSIKIESGWYLQDRFNLDWGNVPIVANIGLIVYEGGKYESDYDLLFGLTMGPFHKKWPVYVYAHPYVFSTNGDMTEGRGGFLIGIKLGWNIIPYSQ